MDRFLKTVEVRWSDLDPNFHLRHSVYYDWAAFCRFSILEEFGLTAKVFAGLKVGPILFREEAIFRREIVFGDQISIDLKLLQSRRDMSRWSFRHRVIKNGDTVAATLTVDGAWLSMETRKLAPAPELAIEFFNELPRDEAFQWSDTDAG